ncbi:peptidylprolyl isomerase [Stigmatella aurantiaca]|uniref:Peptidyl-prolyl cis-trans isomerase n=1 Tax=Stigmatella aurantiaca (strain DW4/3-1) TaxID=378806 RepID=Q08V35_STIAD|nr:peptidylprolyl isomerase [Stigmatella aurantiaca]ADO72087.1 Peptidyl-prolyl cis-trans isomerase [Stigmatella aurantiaca DW4/3-1]EAU64336.1 peptidyl-prolyl cis-trans isomerase [Stigmatella aurantiaca DW4/3-1]
MLRILATSLLLAASLAGAQPAAGKWTKKVQAGKDLYATLKTSQGDIVVQLFSKDAPKTVANFVGLATGEKEWRNPTTGDMSKKPLYSGTIFHRVIPGFMIQGGDPLGSGRGDPGYRFEDEFQSGRTFDKPGILAMANAGPGTNGSQFFITTSTPAHLNNRHTIFGEVVKGYEVVEAISNVPRGAMDRPQTEVTLTQVELSDKPPKGLTPAKTPAPAPGNAKTPGPKAPPKP